MLRIAPLWIVFFALYALLAGSRSLSELGTGAVLAAGVTVYAGLYRRAEERRLDLGARWVPVFARAFASVPADAIRVGRVLARSLGRPPGADPAMGLGVLARQPFRIGGDEPRDAARRALVVLGASLAPNGFTLMMPEDSGLMIMHRLAPAAPHPDREWPV